MTPAVSVVVPVYNPGRFLQPLLDSLDRQVPPPGGFEAVFVDDGSDDGTAVALENWAVTRPHVVVVHQENHGWPGQPRNVGIDRARGEYVYFVDQDDWLADDALARMHAYATTNGSDVVIGKMVGVKRGVPAALFHRSVPVAVIGRDVIQDSQTPHKMFRRAFLDEIGLRFPEGRRRLEDHVFVTSAFLQARVVSIYADSDCYFHISRPDGGNAGFRAYDPAEYYAVVDDVIDIIERHLPPGPQRDAYLGRWLRIELVGRLRSKGVRTLPRAGRQAFYDEISRILRTRIPLGTLRASHPAARLGAAVVRHASMDRFYALEKNLDRVTAHAWRGDGPAVRVSLFDNDRRLRSDVRLSALLRRHARDIADAILEDLGRDDVLLPAGILVGPATVRGSEPGVYRSAAPVGTAIRVHTAIGQRAIRLSAGPRRPVLHLTHVRVLLWLPATRVARRVLGEQRARRIGRRMKAFVRRWRLSPRRRT